MRSDLASAGLRITMKPGVGKPASRTMRLAMALSSVRPQVTGSEKVYG